MHYTFMVAMLQTLFDLEEKPKNIKNENFSLHS
jgi:hypothetical protein